MLITLLGGVCYRVYFCLFASELRGYARITWFSSPLKIKTAVPLLASRSLVITAVNRPNTSVLVQFIDRNYHCNKFLIMLKDNNFIYCENFLFYQEQSQLHDP
jgi:hypothetical protein